MMVAGLRLVLLADVAGDVDAARCGCTVGVDDDDDRALLLLMLMVILLSVLLLVLMSMVGVAADYADIQVDAVFWCGCLPRWIAVAVYGGCCCCLSQARLMVGVAVDGCCCGWLQVLSHVTLLLTVDAAAAAAVCFLGGKLMMALLPLCRLLFPTAAADAVAVTGCWLLAGGVSCGCM